MGRPSSPSFPSFPPPHRREQLRGLPRDRAADLALAIERDDRLAHVIEQIAQVLRRRREPSFAIADLLAHAIERGRELAELVGASHVDARGEVSASDAPRGVREAAQRVHDLRARDHDQHRRRARSEQEGEPEDLTTALRERRVLAREREHDARASHVDVPATDHQARYLHAIFVEDAASDLRRLDRRGRVAAALDLGDRLLLVLQEDGGALHFAVLLEVA